MNLSPAGGIHLPGDTAVAGQAKTTSRCDAFRRLGDGTVRRGGQVRIRACQ
jgi:hypothetical protein